MDYKEQQNEILILAKKTIRYYDLLVEQSNNWLSEEEGFKNFEKRMTKKHREKNSCWIWADGYD